MMRAAASAVHIGPALRLSRPSLHSPAHLLHLPRTILLFGTRFHCSPSDSQRRRPGAVGRGPSAPAGAGPQEGADDAAADEWQQRRIGVGVGIGRPVAGQDAMRTHGEHALQFHPPLSTPTICCPSRFSLALPHLPRRRGFPRLPLTRTSLLPFSSHLTHTHAPPLRLLLGPLPHFPSLLLLDASVVRMSRTESLVAQCRLPLT